MEFNVNPQVFLAAVSAGLALVFDYFPVLAQRFDALSESKKRQIMLGLVFLAAAVVFWGQCEGIFRTNLLCSSASALDLAYNLILAVSLNYGFHQATKPSAAFKANMLSFKPKAK